MSQLKGEWERDPKQRSSVNLALLSENKPVQTLPALPSMFPNTDIFKDRQPSYSAEGRSAPFPTLFLLLISGGCLSHSDAVFTQVTHGDSAVFLPWVIIVCSFSVSWYLDIFRYTLRQGRCSFHQFLNSTCRPGLFDFLLLSWEMRPISTASYISICKLASLSFEMSSRHYHSYLPILESVQDLFYLSSPGSEVSSFPKVLALFSGEWHSETKIRR